MKTVRGKWMRSLLGIAAAGGLGAEARAQAGGGGFGMGPPVTPEIVAKAAAAAPVPDAKGPFEPTWDSLRANYHVPAWYTDAKFGITMHWGLYSIPAYHNEWYEKHMYGTPAIEQWHQQHWGMQDVFGYKDFIPKFTASKFDPDALVALARDAGAKYFMPTCEHHDGFSLWDSQVNPYNSVKMGPKRDVIGELAAAARKAGLKFGVCNHNIEHYTFIAPTAGLKTDLSDPAWQDFYWTDHNDARLQQFLQNWVEKNVEIIDKYHPDIIWYDNGANARAYDPLKLKVAAYYYNQAKARGQEVTMDTKDSCFLAASVLDFEKMIRGPKAILPGVWEAEESAGSTWGYTFDEHFSNPQSMINLLLDVVSKNGNLLLNLSPTGDGEIPAAEQETLRAMGTWLGVNGEAIYASHAWTTFSEGTAKEAWRFTAKGNAVYAIAEFWPGQSITLTSMGLDKGKVTAVELLGEKDPIAFTQDAAGLKITLPATHTGKYAFAFKVSGLTVNAPELAAPAKLSDMR